MAPRVAFALIPILVIGYFEGGPASLAKTFTFPEYPYKETTKNVMVVVGLHWSNAMTLLCGETAWPEGWGDMVAIAFTCREFLFRQFEQACEESGACKMLSQQASSVAKTRCIRECVSPSCYKEIYLFDQLEEGEIDVRLNSFKGCFMQRNGRPRK